MTAPEMRHWTARRGEAMTNDCSDVEKARAVGPGEGAAGGAVDARDRGSWLLFSAAASASDVLAAAAPRSLERDSDRTGLVESRRTRGSTGVTFGFPEGSEFADMSGSRDGSSAAASGVGWERLVSRWTGGAGG